MKKRLRPEIKPGPKPKTTPKKRKPMTQSAIRKRTIKTLETRIKVCMKERNYYLAMGDSVMAWCEQKVINKLREKINSIKALTGSEKISDLSC